MGRKSKAKWARRVQAERSTYEGYDVWERPCLHCGAPIQARVAEVRVRLAQPLAQGRSNATLSVPCPKGCHTRVFFGWSGVVAVWQATPWGLGDVLDAPDGPTSPARAMALPNPPPPPGRALAGNLARLALGSFRASSRSFRCAGCGSMEARFEVDRSLYCDACAPDALAECAAEGGCQPCVERVRGRRTEP